MTTNSGLSTARWGKIVLRLICSAQRPQRNILPRSPKPIVVTAQGLQYQLRTMRSDSCSVIGG